MDQPNTAFGQMIVSKIDELAKISETDEGLTRLFLSAEHRRAADLILTWMRDAGMSATLDEIGNVVGRYEAEAPDRPALLLGSHFDTVRDAGRWDGPLGIITAIACVKHLHQHERRLPFAVEVVAFADEEGTRFSSTLLGSKAFAGTWDGSALSMTDGSGQRMDDALKQFGLDPERVGTAARDPSRYLAYIELHIEQGPVLEAENLPVAVVTGISGATRLRVRLSGMAGHAGTVPTAMRRDALAGAAECVTMIESHCRSDVNLFGTVGQMEVSPGATNVIPGAATFSVDLRSISDGLRTEALDAIIASIRHIADCRGLGVSIETTHQHGTVACAPWLQSQIGGAIERLGYASLSIPSGAGHDAMAMADLTDVGMIFLRCRGGISHHPDEYVSEADADVGARVLLDVIENFRPRQQT